MFRKGDVVGWFESSGIWRMGIVENAQFQEWCLIWVIVAADGEKDLFDKDDLISIGRV